LSREVLYEATSEIQVATIDWSLASAPEPVKVDVWDVADGALGADTRPSEAGVTTQAFRPLDAATVDVYRDCHVVVFLVDPRRAETLAHVVTSIGAVPRGVEKLILVNFRDAPDTHRTTTVADVEVALTCAGHSLDRGKNSGSEAIRIFECSMADCFGLSLLYDYLAVPFLLLKAAEQRRALDQSLAQLAASGAALDARIAVASHTQHVATCAARHVVDPADAPLVVSRAAKLRCSSESVLAAPEKMLPECSGQVALSTGPGGNANRARSAFDAWLDEDCNLTLSPVTAEDSNSETDDDFYGPQSSGFAMTLAFETTQLSESESKIEAQAASPLTRDAHDEAMTRAFPMNGALDCDTGDAARFDGHAASVYAQVAQNKTTSAPEEKLEVTQESKPEPISASDQDDICTCHDDEIPCATFASPILPRRSRLSKLKVETPKPQTEVSAAARAAILVAMDAIVDNRSKNEKRHKTKQGQ
jgi:hypothetical protein